MWRTLLIVFYVTIEPRRSLQLKNDESMPNAQGVFLSDNIVEDSYIMAPELIKKYHYPIEVHYVTTSDGYILELHRIPYGRYNHTKPDEKKPVVFLMHGLLLSSACWVLMGPSSGLAYILAEEGYDVWMGNARGNIYSRRHVFLNPNSVMFNDFWKFSWDEIGNIDLPTMIDFVLDRTGQQKLHYIGHSQGTTTFFVMCSLRPLYNTKIISMHALAPVAFMAYNKNPLLCAISPFSTKIASLATLIGSGEVMRNTKLNALAGQALCRDEVVFQPICSNIVFLIGGWDESHINKTMLPVLFGHVPAGSSIRQLAHYGQGISTKALRRYDHGFISNKKIYGTFTPPNYDLSKITAPIYLHYANKDPLADVSDVDKLWNELGQPTKILIPYASFSHLDFIWAIDVKKLAYDKMISIMSTLS